MPHRLRFPVVLASHVLARYRDERLSQSAASLAFTTLLSLVPLIAVGLAVVSRLPVSARFGAVLEKFLLDNLLPAKAGAVIATYALQFSQKADQLTVIGVAVLVATAFSMVLTIDHTFNVIWRVEKKRSLLRRLVVSGLVVVAGPVALGASLAAVTFVVSTSLGWVDEPRWLRAIAFRLLAEGFLVGVLTLVYFAAPGGIVRLGHALAGALFSAIGLGLVQQLLGLYVVKLPTFSILYGAFSAVPIFLLWLYLSWSVILLGALIAACLPDVGRSDTRPASDARALRSDRDLPGTRIPEPGESAGPP
jgi:membrane protein